MRYLDKIDDYQGENRSVITLGKFDGFHRGHQKLLEAVKCYVQLSEKQGEKIESVVFAFDMSNFRREQSLPFEQIMLKGEQDEFLTQKVDYLIHCPFDEQIRYMTAKDFIEEVLVKKIKAKYIVVGSDFRFGYQAKGDVALLRKYSEQHGYEVVEIEKEMYGNQEISSTHIKEQLQCGNIEVANEMLGYQYSITGTVIHGRKLGRTIGFPTMNIPVPKEKFLPPYGVYIAKVMIDGALKYGVVNLGNKPTVSQEGQPLVEAYVLDYEGDAYGEQITVLFEKLLRREVKFENIEALRQQIENDFAQTESWVKNGK